MNLLLIGMNHRTAPLALREHFAVEDVAPYLTKLVDGEVIAEAVLLSTCNRVEAIVCAERPDVAAQKVRRFFERDLGRGALPQEGVELTDALYELHGPDAVRHLFRVASSIDSMVLGEPQILGQVKDSYRAAVAGGACGSILTRLYQHAFSAAKRVRSETRIAERPVSVARLAADLAAEIFESLADKTALLIGAGEMVELALETMRSAGLTRVRIANRTRARAEALAGRFDGTAHGLEELAELLPGADVVLSCIGGHDPVVLREPVERALRGRGHRPLFVIDLGVPRNVDPRVDGIDGVYLYDVDDLGRVAAANAEERGREKARAETIVREEAQRFDGWLAALAAVPTIRDLRERAERIRVREVERAAARLAGANVPREVLETLSRGIVNKLLHAPLSRLRAQEDREQGLATLEAARTLFALDEGDPPDEESQA
ncbi:MAG TPA: glutamyl-tRNA reductase [Myxococcota bacterium]|nr:glutamyl-tRNA reductase [Myxococcota bacterium]